MRERERVDTQQNSVKDVENDDDDDEQQKQQHRHQWWKSERGTGSKSKKL